MARSALNVFCQHPPIYEAEYTTDSERTPTTAVLEAISRAAEKDVMDLPPLYEAVDPDGLHRTFSGADAETVLAFAIDDFHVFVRGDGRIRVYDATRRTEVAPVFDCPT